MKNRIYDIVKIVPSAESLWAGSHKIPWNDPAFSARILREHLSQDHHLASRKANIIDAQAAWIRIHCLGSGDAILDLGCGPGLYCEPVSGEDHTYLGIDFGPASIQHAKAQYGVPGRCVFRLGDVTKADYAGPHDLVMMLYGELNVFSPKDCRLILAKAHSALVPGGRLLVEFQNPDVVRGVGEAPNTWTRCDAGGLFSDNPYVCLTENHWFETEQVALQCFYIMEADGTARTYRSTTRAWSQAEMEALLKEAGFVQVTQKSDWPVQDDSLLLMSATKAI